jgi:anti-sigma factor RsiW
MKCQEAEKLIHRLLDGRLPPQEIRHLEEHLAECSACTQKKKEYEWLQQNLQSLNFPEPQPDYWEKIRRRLKTSPSPSPLLTWKKWALRAVPVALIFLIILATAIIFLTSSSSPQMSQTELLLLQNSNPFIESQAIFTETSPIDKNLRLIFSSLETNTELRR